MSQSWKNDQIVLQKNYQLQAGSLLGDKIRYTDSVLLFEGSDTEPFLTCTFSCIIPDDKISNGIGAWNIQVLREGTVLASGEYQYNLTAAPVLTSDIGLETTPYTKQELINEFVNGSYLTQPLKYGYKVFIDTVKLIDAVPGATYISVGSEEMFGQVTALPQGLSHDELKLGIQPKGYGGYSMSSSNYIYYNSLNKQQIYGAIYYGSDSKLVNDMFVYIGLYDENFQLLGHYITVLQFDQDHVADGYTAASNWNPIQK